VRRVVLGAAGQVLRTPTSEYLESSRAAAVRRPLALPEGVLEEVLLELSRSAPCMTGPAHGYSRSSTWCLGLDQRLLDA
jgi:hypothetical protein